MANYSLSTENLSAILPKEYLFSSLSELYENGLPAGLNTGLDCLDNLVRFDTKRLCVITGVPNDGKSEFVDFLTVAYNRLYGMKTLYYSPENQPVSLHVAKLVSKFTNKPFDKAKLSSEELLNGVNYIGDNFYFFNYSKVKTFSQILEQARILIREKGVKIVVLDAFNKIEGECKEDILTFISRTLDELCNFAITEDVLVLLVAHPRKMEWDEKSMKYKRPRAYDINGSANFFNKCDYAITVERLRDREDDTRVKIWVDKVKFANYGKQGVIELNYDKESGNYCSCLNNAVEDDFVDELDDYFGVSDAYSSNKAKPFVFPSAPSLKEPLDVQVSVYSGANDNIGDSINLKDFLLTDNYKGIAEYIRRGVSPEDRKERKKRNKDRIPCATISGLFSQRDGKHLIAPSRLLSVDIDYSDNKEKLNEISSILRNMDSVVYFAKSITGDGYFAIFKIAEPNKYKEHFLALEKEFRQYGITLDKSCKDISRLRFATYDEDAYYNPNASTYLNVVEDNPISTSQPKYSLPNTSKTDAERIEEHIKLLKENNLSIPDDYNTWFNIGMSLNAAFGEDGRQYFHTISSLSQKYDRCECDEQYDKIIEHYSEDNHYSLGTLIHYFKEAEQQLKS